MDEKMKLAQKAAYKAGELILSFYDNIKTSFKNNNSNDIVTQADIESEKAIIQIIQNNYPSHAILSEESYREIPLDSDNLWIIDPLDGTNNYSNKIPQFSISISFAQKGDIKIGVIYDPCRKELFSAIKGEGAYLNGKKIEVSRKKMLNEAIIGTGFYYDRGEIMKKTLDSIYCLFNSKIRGIRRMGSAALDLAWIACGRFDSFFEYMLSPWDIAAGILIVNEAGGACSDRLGKPMTLMGNGIISSNGILHENFLKHVIWR